MPLFCTNDKLDRLAIAHSLGKLPESEMEKIELFDDVPENFTYDRDDAIKDYEMAKNMLNAWERD